jgi:Na+-translocating ferredoxin:NAD+ oxidoreductase subunit E
MSVQAALQIANDAPPVARPATRGWIAVCALCPLFAVSDMAVTAIGMGLIVLLVGPLAGALFQVGRRWLSAEVQLAGAFLTFAGVIACVELLLRAFLFDLHAALGVFAPLLAVNILLNGVFAAPEPHKSVVLSALSFSAAMAAMLVVLGLGREFVGRGSLFHDAALMFGAWAGGLEVKVFSVDMGFLLGMLPPGAFISFGLLLAMRNWLKDRGVRT